ncbi:MAG: hypothetical protein PHW13_12250 [Methylococcales bacterium]|nr:hypothetical protein [Methylococcales bacterium]
MRLLNLFLAGLLCFVIPLQGFAGVAAAKTACSAEPVAVMAADDTGGHGCCNDAETTAKTGKACKAEQDCQPAGSGLINQTEALPPVFAAGKIPLFTSRLATDSEPSATWRPPNPV